MKAAADFETLQHDPRDPNPWLALYLDQSTPLSSEVKGAWLVDSSRGSRQFLLPFIRPLARCCIILTQVLKAITPRRWAAPSLLHWILAEGLKRFVAPEANWLVLRHFHLGSQILSFIAQNAPNQVETSPLLPADLDALKDDLFLQHDLNLFNFVIRLGRMLREHGAELQPLASPDLSMITRPPVELEAQPHGLLNFIDLQTAIECFTPVYQLFLTDNDFWRATNSLQLDETIGMYAASILNTPEHLALLNNKHPMVPLSTLRAGHRLVLHGLSTEILHALLLRLKEKGTP